MATLEDEIRDLKARIEGYEAKLDAATTEAGEERYANLITETRKTLNALLQQQQQQQAQTPPPPQKTSQLYHCDLLLRDASGGPDAASLASLAGGFRKHVVANAAALGITGTIQRYSRYNILLKIVGNREQLGQFFSFLRTCINQGMMDAMESRTFQEIPFQVMDNFHIIGDHSSTVQKGPNSDDDHDKKSESSADSGVLRGFQPQHPT